MVCLGIEILPNYNKKMTSKYIHMKISPVNKFYDRVKTSFSSINIQGRMRLWVTILRI